MAFINERIPEEEKEKLTFDVFTQPDGSKPTLSMWTIDRAQNAFLVLTNIEGGGYCGTEPEEYFVLNWNDRLIRFSGEYKISGKKGEGYSLAWQLSEVEIPADIEKKRPEVLALITEALNAKGLFFNSAGIVSVTVKY